MYTHTPYKTRDFAEVEYLFFTGIYGKVGLMGPTLFFWGSLLILVNYNLQDFRRNHGLCSVQHSEPIGYA